MYEFIKGNVAELTPASVVIDAGGTGYFINISLNTYSSINGRENAMMFVHQVVREDAHLLYGFHEKGEREIFRLLISVNGIGANTAIMMLSSFTPEELRNAIASENVSLLKSIKGIGAKTAQRVIIDLKDKIANTAVSGHIFSPQDNTTRNEALSALEMLGFNKRVIERTLDNILNEQPDQTVEQLIKTALKSL